MAAGNIAVSPCALVVVRGRLMAVEATMPMMATMPTMAAGDQKEEAGEHQRRHVGVIAPGVYRPAHEQGVQPAH